MARQEKVRWIVLALLAIGVAVGLAAGPARADESAAVGKVVALQGDAWVDHVGTARRALECGDTLVEGDVLVTGPGARAAVQAGDVLAQIAGGSEVRLGRGPGGVPEVNVEKGHAHVRRLDLANARKGKGHLAPPGDCATSPRTPSVGAGPVPLDTLIGSPAERFNPTDVAAAPPGPSSPGPQPPAILNPCAVAVGGCFAPATPPRPILATGVVEQPPVSVLPPGVGPRR